MTDTHALASATRSGPRTSLPLCQVAYSVSDVAALDWYRRVVGFARAGETAMRGAEVAHLQGLPEMEAEMKWLLDQQDYFELEFFLYNKPEPRALPADWAPRDIGYAVLGVHVSDFDAALDRAREHGAVGPIVGPPGRRRAWGRQPGGPAVEFMEDDPRGPAHGSRVRPDVAAVVRSVRASVPDLERSCRFFVDALGLVPATEELHGSEYDELWAADEERDRITLWAGDVAVELVEYRQRSGGTSPADRQHSDLGIVHIALGARERVDYEDALDRVRSAGYQGIEMDFGYSRCCYIVDDQGFVVEILNTPSITGYPGGES